ncbi:protein A16-like [Anopheles funestus]|uniref:protein A16-like n=1 Tax=Anopheles funestus TaxID=62324 RepID=UPI0020C68D25|nr:protein A16-like [Anopheles funestus]
MFLTKGNFAVVLLLVVFLCLSLALPRVDDNVLKPDEAKDEASDNVPIDDETELNDRVGRFLLPADFAVRKKKFTIGTRGTASFFRSWRNCIEDGKGFATIESEEEQTFLTHMLKSIGSNTRYWIGATNVGNSAKNLTWITTDLPVQTAPDSLRLTGPTCIALTQSGSWRKNNCFSSSSVYPYLCEEYY